MARREEELQTGKNPMSPPKEPPNSTSQTRKRPINNIINPGKKLTEDDILLYDGQQGSKRQSLANIQKNKLSH